MKSTRKRTQDRLKKRKRLQRAVFHFRVTDSEAAVIRASVPHGKTLSSHLRGIVLGGLKIAR